MFPRISDGGLSLITSGTEKAKLSLGHRVLNISSDLSLSCIRAQALASLRKDQLDWRYSMWYGMSLGRPVGRVEATHNVNKLQDLQRSVPRMPHAGKPVLVAQGLRDGFQQRISDNGTRNGCS